MDSLKILTILILVVFSFATANDTYMNYDYRTGAVFPLNNENIKMMKEIVKYDYRDSEFSTTFWMKNTTDTEQKVTLGFPVDPDRKKYLDRSLFDENRKFNEQEYMNKIDNDINFRTWVNDIEIKRKFMKIESESYGYKYAFVADIIFKPNEELIIKNIFTQQMGKVINTAGLTESNLKYDPITGANWKDRIDHAYFEFIVPKELKRASKYQDFVGDYPNGKIIWIKHFEEQLNTPDPSKIEIKDSLRIISWEFHDFEPDFTLNFLHKYWIEQYSNWFIDFNIHTLHISEYIFNSSQDYVKFNEKIDKFKEFLQSKNYDIFDNLKECNKFIKYYYEQMIEYNDLFKRKDKYNEIRKRFMINLIYALNGYDFKDDQWKKLFECFKWYKPTSTAPVLPDDERIMIDRIKNL